VGVVDPAQQQDGEGLARVSGMAGFYLNVFNKYRGFPVGTYTFAFCHPGFIDVIPPAEQRGP
jgi:hypothetical protein